MNKQSKFFIDSELSCVKRGLDAKKIADYLINNGYKQVFHPTNADIIVLVTCGALDLKTAQSLKKTKKYQKYNAELIVAGCVPEIAKEELKKIFSGKIISTKNLDNFGGFFKEDPTDFSTMDDANLLFISIKKRTINFFFNDFSLNLALFYAKYIAHNEISKVYKYLIKRKYFVRVSWGCTSNCAYCGIKNAIGEFHSKPVDECIKEFKRGLDQGYSHITLTSDDTGSYGIDIGSSLPKLLDELTKIPGDFKISITDLNPQWIIRYFDDLKDIFKRGKITSIDLSFQSGNARVLKLMQRYNDVDKMKETYLKLREMFPEIYIFTETIAGFPTETEEEFKETLSFIKDVGFDYGTVYHFSLKSDTKAEEIEPKISAEEIIYRLKYSKKYLKKNGFKVFYGLIFLPRFLRINLFFVKKEKRGRGGI